MSVHSAPGDEILADYRWLVSDEGALWLDRCRFDPAPLEQQVKRLRRHLSPRRTQLVLTQMALRRRAERRFESSSQLFWTDLALQQATDSRLAAYKAARFAGNAPVVDLCCGIGGDLLALAQRGPTLGIERNSVLAYLAAANLRATVNSKGWVSCGDVRAVSILPEVAIHCDPDRRPGGRRTVQIENFEPGPEWIGRFIQHPAGLALKLSPATDGNSEHLRGAELEWIGHRRECQQLVAWFGPLAQVPGRRIATKLHSDGTPESLSAIDIPELVIGDRVRRYVFEPSASLLAAGLAAEFAARESLTSLTAGGGYLTGDNPLQSHWAHVFEVLAVMPYRIKRLKAWIKQHDIGRLQIKQRGVSVDLQKLEQQLRATGSASATLLLLQQGQKIVAIASRPLAP